MGMTIFRDNKPVILIDRHIGNDPMYGEGITGEAFVRELNFIENSGHIECEVWINTVGGSVLDGMAIYNAIANSTITVNTRNVGVAASTGGWLMQAGKKRIGNYYAQLMMHNTSGGDDKGRNALDESIVSMLSVRCSKSENWIKDRMDEEVWINAEDGMKKHGLYDEVDYNCGVEVKEMFENKTPFAAYNQLRSIVNKLIEEPKNIKMKKVTNALSLNEDANEEAVLKGVNDLKEEIKTLTDKKKELEDALAKIETDKVQADKEKSSVEMVENAAKEGRIEDKEEVKKPLIALANINPEQVKNMLAAMPVKKIANLLPVGGGADESRASWDYDKWQKEDGEGLINMYKNARPQYDLLLEKFKTKNTK